VSRAGPGPAEEQVRCRAHPRGQSRHRLRQGSAYGDKGPERLDGGFDGTAFWTRSGVGHALTPEELGGALSRGIDWDRIVELKDSGAIA
jgi:hypothetical protein